MDETKKQDQTSTHKIGIYLWIWGLLFVLSFCSYMVDWFQFQGLLKMVFNIDFYVSESSFNYDVFYAFILGTLCNS